MYSEHTIRSQKKYPSRTVWDSKKEPNIQKVCQSEKIALINVAKTKVLNTISDLQRKVFDYSKNCSSLMSHPYE